MSRPKKGSWVIAPGRNADEVGYCTRCGDGLTGCKGQLLDVFVAMMLAFVKVHSECKK